MMRILIGAWLLVLASVLVPTIISLPDVFDSDFARLSSSVLLGLTALLAILVPIRAKADSSDDLATTWCSRPEPPIPLSEQLTKEVQPEDPPGPPITWGR